MKRKLCSRIKALEAVSKQVEESEELVKERQLYESSFYEFFKAAWPSMEPGELVEGWHIKAIAAHLEAVVRGEIRNLLINIPPAVGKTSLITKAFPAWVWTFAPEKQFMYASYNHSLSMNHSRDCRNLIKSDWYQKYWGQKFKIVGDSDTMRKFDNDKFGYRITTTIGSAPTGLHADYLITDDANNAKDAESEIMRQNTNDWYSHVWPTRFNNQKTGCFINVQQRLHENDLSGFILRLNLPDLVYLRLPMEYERGHPCMTVPLRDTDGKPWFDPRKEDGELLWPASIGPTELLSLKTTLGTYGTAGQLQQRPAPIAGGLVKASWFRVWQQDEPPECLYTVQSWDVAVTISDTACYSACTTWGVFLDKFGINNIILLSMWKGKAEYPQVRKMAQRLAKNYLDTDEDDPYPDSYKCPPDIVLVEDTTVSKPLISDLIQANIYVTRFSPKRWGDKEGRVFIATQLIESGRVWLPGLPPDYEKLRRYANTFLRDCILFPNDVSRDTVDTMSQALIYIKNQGVVINPADTREEPYPKLTDKALY